MSWEVEIIGDRSDLEELSKLVRNEELSIVKKNENFILRSKYLDVLSNYDEVNEKIIELLILVNASAKLTLDTQRVIKHGTIFQLKENITTAKMLITSKLGISSKVSFNQISHSNSAIETHNQSIPVGNWIEIAQRDQNVKKAFKQISHDFDSWDAFYKIIEILEDDQFEPVRKKRRGIKEGKYRVEVNRLTGTADSYKEILLESRHAREFEGSINNPMQYSEAKSFVRKILFQWLAQKEQKRLNLKE